MLEVITSIANQLLALLIGSFLLTLFILPRIRENSLRFGLGDKPNERSSHSKIVPTLGGVAFYIAMLPAILIAQQYDMNSTSLTLLVSISIVFFTGIKDDLHNLSPRMKFLGQLIAVGLLMTQSDFRIDSLHGFLGIYELPILVSVIFSSTMILGFINAFNLIDGIDGLAAITGIVIASSLGFIFYKLKLYQFAFLCVSIIGMLIAFLRFNFSFKKKIFMGDTGSLVLGLVLGLMTLKLLSLGSNSFSVFSIESSEVPLLLLSILIVPFSI